MNKKELEEIFESYTLLKGCHYTHVKKFTDEDIKRYTRLTNDYFKSQLTEEDIKIALDRFLDTRLGLVSRTPLDFSMEMFIEWGVNGRISCHLNRKDDEVHQHIEYLQRELDEKKELYYRRFPDRK